MRLVFALLGVLLLTAATPARDWSKTVTPTRDGAYVVGNPAARAKLVEYASYTCPHCGAFSRESDAVLKGQMIRSGTVSLEFRHMLRDRLDLAAAVLARCAGPRAFSATSSAIFAAQGQWLERGYDYMQANQQRLTMYPVLGQLRAYADGAGLTQLIQARGLSPAAIDACFADQAGVDRITAMTANAPAEVDSTPTFFLNGKIVPHVGWAQLEPQLRAAGAK